MIVVNPSRSETLPDFTKANLEAKMYPLPCLLSALKADFGLSGLCSPQWKAATKLVDEHFNDNCTCRCYFRSGASLTGKHVVAFSSIGEKDTGRLKSLLKLGHILKDDGKPTREKLETIETTHLSSWPIHERQWQDMNIPRKRRVIEGLMPDLIRCGYITKRPPAQEVASASARLIVSPAMPSAPSSLLEDPPFPQDIKLGLQMKAYVTALSDDFLLPMEVAILQHALLHPGISMSSLYAKGEGLGTHPNPLRKNRSLELHVPAQGNHAEVYYTWTYKDHLKDITEMMAAPSTEFSPRMRAIRKEVTEALFGYGTRMSHNVCRMLGVSLGAGSVFELQEENNFFEWLVVHARRSQRCDGTEELTAAFTEKEYSMLRTISVDNGISGRKFGAVYAGFFLFFKKRLPKASELISRRALTCHFLRLQAIDTCTIRDEVLGLDEEGGPCTWSIGYMTDCTNSGEERLVSYFTFPRMDMSGPKAVFTGIGPVADKKDKTLSLEALDRLYAFLGEEGVTHLAGSCTDHAAINEILRFFEQCRCDLPLYTAPFSPFLSSFTTVYSFILLLIFHLQVQQHANEACNGAPHKCGRRFSQTGPHHPSRIGCSVRGWDWNGFTPPLQHVVPAGVHSAQAGHLL
jgi:hypothetical protein